MLYNTNLKFDNLIDIPDLTGSEVIQEENQTVTLVGSEVTITESRCGRRRAARFSCQIRGDRDDLFNFQVTLQLDRQVEGLNMSVIIASDNSNPDSRTWRWDIAGLPCNPIPALCLSSFPNKPSISVRIPKAELQPASSSAEPECERDYKTPTDNGASSVKMLSFTRILLCTMLISTHNLIHSSFHLLF